MRTLKMCAVRGLIVAVTPFALGCAFFGELRRQMAYSFKEARYSAHYEWRMIRELWRDTSYQDVL